MVIFSKRDVIDRNRFNIGWGWPREVCMKKRFSWDKLIYRLNQMNKKVRREIMLLNEKSEINGKDRISFE